MGQGLEPLTADLCLSSRSQPPQLPSRADFFEQSKKRNVFRASTATTTTTTKNTKAARAAAAQLQPQLLLSPLRGPSTTTTTTTLVRKPLPAGTWIKWHQTARPRTTLTASGIGCSVTRVPRATTRITRVHRRPCHGDDDRDQDLDELSAEVATATRTVAAEGTSGRRRRRHPVTVYYSIFNATRFPF